MYVRHDGVTRYYLLSMEKVVTISKNQNIHAKWKLPLYHIQYYYIIYILPLKFELNKLLLISLVTPFVLMNVV